MEKLNYKPSCFNLEVKTQSETYLVNTRTTAILNISDQKLKKIAGDLLNHESNFNSYSSEIIGFLYNNGFILKDSEDELKIIEKIHKTARNGKDSLAIGVVLTLACNFRCIYCYEDHVNIKLSQELKESILKYIKTNTKNKKRLRIAWFGGEPLLEINSIKDLSETFISYCNENQISYKARISTNGYLLSNKNAKILHDCSVNEVQITIDGTPEYHNGRRYLVNKKPTFNRIVQNIKYCVDNKLFERLIIRINIDNFNYTSIQELISEYLIDYRHGIILSFSIAMSPDKVDLEEPFTIPPEKYWAIEKELTKKAIELGFHVLKGYPIPCTSFCMGYQKNSILIDPRGNVNRCPKYISITDENFGVLNNDGIIQINNGVQKQWDNWNPLLDEECASCKVLPLCMGGCLLFLQSKKSKETTHRCFAKHDILNSLLIDNDINLLSGSGNIC